MLRLAELMMLVSKRLYLENMHRTLALSLAGICLILHIPTVSGQTTFAAITGTVTDPSGAVVQGAKVSVTSEGEGTVRDVTTGSTGVFTVPNLTVGAYRLQVTASGFGTYDRTGIILSANQVFNADIKMAMAQAGVTVQVTDAGAAISTGTFPISRPAATCRNFRWFRAIPAIRASTPSSSRTPASTACRETA